MGGSTGAVRRRESAMKEPRRRRGARQGAGRASAIAFSFPPPPRRRSPRAAPLQRGAGPPSMERTHTSPLLAATRGGRRRSDGAQSLIHGGLRASYSGLGRRRRGLDVRMPSRRHTCLTVGLIRGSRIKWHGCGRDKIVMADLRIGEL